MCSEMIDIHICKLCPDGQGQNTPSWNYLNTTDICASVSFHGLTICVLMIHSTNRTQGITAGVPASRQRLSLRYLFTGSCTYKRFALSGGKTGQILVTKINFQGPKETKKATIYDIDHFSLKNSMLLHTNCIKTRTEFMLLIEGREREREGDRKKGA